MLLIRKRYLMEYDAVDVYLLRDSPVGRHVYGPLTKKFNGGTIVNPKLMKFARVDRLPPGNTAIVHLEDALTERGLQRTCT